MKQCGVVAIVFILLFGVQVVSAAREQPVSGAWIYVGGSGPGNYTRIQAAIDNATPGDTVYVYHDASPYREVINITKPLRILGENRETTVIDADGIYSEDGYAVRLSAQHITFSGFTVQNSDFGVKLYYTSNNTIADNNLYDVEYPFTILDSSNNTIKNNLISHLANIVGILIGIYLGFSNDNLIQGNTIIDDHPRFGDFGIELSFCARNIIANTTLVNSSIKAWEEDYERNTFIDNTNNGKPLVILRSASNRVIDDADQVVLVDCINVTVAGVNLSQKFVGVLLYRCDDCTISGCTFTMCDTAIRVTSSNRIAVSNNTVTHQPPGLYEDYTMGIWLSAATNSTVSSNTVTGRGVQLLIRYSHHNEITHNILTEGTGIKMDQSDGIHIVSNAFIRTFPDAYFESCNRDIWLHNYWGRPWILPRPIFGISYSYPYYTPIPSIAFDLRPALLPP